MKIYQIRRRKMDIIVPTITNAVISTIASLSHNWPYLVVSVFAAVAMKLYMDPEKASRFFIKYKNAGIAGATAAAVATPFCSCGTTAIVIGMMATMIPWAPIIAFMVASPLSSPEGLIYSAGIFGWPFAIAFFVSSILLGFAGGIAATFFESRGMLRNQTRFTARVDPVKVMEDCGCPTAVQSCACSIPPARLQNFNYSVSPTLTQSCDCDSLPAPACCGPEIKKTKEPRITWKKLALEGFNMGKRLLVMFVGFAFIGYLLNGLIPSDVISSMFGNGNHFSIPLAATLGLPFYINSEASLPLLRTFIDSGMSQGSAMAFLITGSGTSLGAITGALTIAKWKVIAIVVGTLWVGGIVLGYGYELLITSGII
jgi:uncharacterized membrane protein YraQ (UPF0718 family)